MTKVRKFDKMNVPIYSTKVRWRGGRKMGYRGISFQKNVYVWLLFAIFFPLLIWGGYTISPISLHDIPTSHIVAFLILIVALSLMPMVVGDIHIFLAQGISLAIFLSFGLFAEMVITLISVITLILYVRLSKHELYRLPINLLMFSTASFISGFVFYLLGGEHGNTNLLSLQGILPILMYVVCYFAVNQVFLYSIFRYLHNSKRGLITSDTKWDAVTSILTFPVGLIMFMLYEQVGLVAVLYVGIPFLILTLILKLYHASQKVNNYLQRAADVGHDLTERLNVSSVIDVFLERVSTLFPVDYAAIIDIKEDRFHLLRQKFKGENGELIVHPEDEICKMVKKQKRGVSFRTRKEYSYLPNIHIPPGIESVMCVPVIRNQIVEGFVVVGTSKRRAYDKSQLMIMDILASHFGVALVKAKHYEDTKNRSERCALTNLYNFRFFETVLEKEYEKLEVGESESLSLILLDLDHFKSINDTYGHQSGNEILKQVADRLSLLIGENGIVARYGGEEFVVLLPNVDRKKCYDFAEKIRVNLANRSFTLKQHIRDTVKPQLVKVTASIGFATAPEDAEDSLDLIRHADRAMYVGAKQAGRNKVAEYRKIS